MENSPAIKVIRRYVSAKFEDSGINIERCEMELRSLDSSIAASLGTPKHLLEEWEDVIDNYRQVQFKSASLSIEKSAKELAKVEAWNPRDSEEQEAKLSMVDQISRTLKMNKKLLIEAEKELHESLDDALVERLTHHANAWEESEKQQLMDRKEKIIAMIANQKEIEHNREQLFQKIKESFSNQGLI